MHFYAARFYACYVTMVARHSDMPIRYCRREIFPCLVTLPCWRVRTGNGAVRRWQNYILEHKKCIKGYVVEYHSSLGLSSNVGYVGVRYEKRCLGIAHVFRGLVC